MTNLTLIIFFFISLFSIFFLNKFFVTKKILLSQSGEKHQMFASKNSVPLIGGIYLVILFILFLLKFEKYFELLVLFSIFILGIYTDLKILKSPKKRLLIQTLFIVLLTSVAKLEIVDTRIDLINFFLEIKIINFFFVVFCLLILMNGSNFIDGLNGLLVGYFIMITLVLIKIGVFNFYYINMVELFFFLLTLILIYCSNILNKLYLGDSGVYAISMFFGLVILDYHNKFSLISPYFFILILWYPCFENLFSIIRKFKLKRSPINPDTNHLHQLLFYFFKKKNKLSDLTNNNLSSFSILLFNLFVFMFALNDIYSTKLQIAGIFISVLIYVIIYLYLFKFKFNN
tara:strand:+ start:24864 stop:25895 length:1032 start_codon:yes stop_codon:yes gene_type:complete